MKTFIVEYELDYTHRVQVGVTARSECDALRKAEKAFDNATIWDDTADMPLLYDDYEEKNDNTLEFRVVDTVGHQDDLPPPAICVHIERRRRLREEACSLLISAFEEAEQAGQFSVSLESLTAAYTAAKSDGRLRIEKIDQISEN